MTYPFFCPNCGQEENISMRMSDYSSTGHLCPICNTEMKRTIESLVCGLSVDKTNSFFRKCN
jgi:predicted nucleic acid-binding Zn ribbon protein